MSDDLCKCESVCGQAETQGTQGQQGVGGVSLQVVMPKGALGASADDSWLDALLRAVAVKYDADPEQSWASKYGTDFENDEFMMHRYCWCERDDCPWCAGCDCPDTAYHYFVDGKEVTWDEWMQFYRDLVGPACYEPGGSHDPEALREYDRKSAAANKRRTSRHDPECDFCKGVGVATKHGGEPRRPAPNFWYKPTDFKVWWYKYIGRDMETNRQLTQIEALEMMNRLLGEPAKESK